MIPHNEKRKEWKGLLQNKNNGKVIIKTGENID